MQKGIIMSDILGKIIMGALQCAVEGKDPEEMAEKLVKEICGEQKEETANHVTGSVHILIEKSEGDVPARFEICGNGMDITNAFSQAIANFAMSARNQTIAKCMVKTIYEGAISHIENGGHEE